MYNGVKVLDVHGHVSMPVDYRLHIGNMLAQNTPFLLQVPPAQLDAAVQVHLKELDDRNIDVQIVGPRPVYEFHWMRPFLQEAWCRGTNDLIAQFVQQCPDRLLGAAQLPQNAERDTSSCLPEFERCVKELGFVAAYVNPDPSGTRQAPGLHDPYWYPLYTKAQEWDIPLIVHPSVTYDTRVESLYANYQVNNVVEEYIATQILSRSDVFERFPTLRVVVCHCGGALDRWISSDPHLGQRDVSRNLFFDTCVYDVPFLEAAIKQRGVDRMLFGTEVPGSGRAPRPETGRPGDDIVPIIGGFEFLTEAQKIKIFHDNPKRVFPALAPLALVAGAAREA
jgi:predicted TIM-barrel fold metal-dependent hydrolase